MTGTTQHRKSTQLNCFSPPVMVATLIIETSLALYALWRYKMSVATRLIVTMLFALATFQLAEYFVCTGPGPQAVPWSRLGFVAITLLPPLGLHLMHVLASKPARKLVYGTYAVMAAFIAFFLLSPMAFTGHQCTGNYVIFQFSDRVTGVYSIYYFGLLLAGIGLGTRWAKMLEKGNQQRKLVQALITGYFVFLLPAAIANVVRPETRRGIPSVLCGFAILLALILALYILPRVAKKRAAHS